MYVNDQIPESSFLRKFISVKQLSVLRNSNKKMENDQQTRSCDNCRKPFPSDKIDLHEAYCFRNIKKCPQCEKMIDVNEQETHEAEEHSEKRCEMCGEGFVPAVFESHGQSCPKKPVECKFCENTYAFVQVEKHKEACGSRTQPCTICQKLVMIRQLPEHTEKCQRRAEQRRVEVSQDIARHHSRNENQVPARERQNSQNVRQRRKSSASKNVIARPAKIKPSHMIGPETIKPIIDPVPISIRMAMRGKERLPLKSKN